MYINLERAEITSQFESLNCPWRQRLTDVAPEKWSADSLRKLPVVIFWMIKTSDFCFPFSPGREERESASSCEKKGRIPLRSFVRRSASFRPRAHPCDSHRIVIRAFINYRAAECSELGSVTDHVLHRDHKEINSSFINRCVFSWKSQACFSSCFLSLERLKYLANMWPSFSVKMWLKLFHRWKKKKKSYMVVKRLTKYY